PPLTVTVLVPPAVPPIVTSVPVKPLTGSLNTAVKLIGGALVGSGWPVAWLIVTVGGVVSGGVKLTLLSVLVEAVLRLPAAAVVGGFSKLTLLSVLVDAVLPLPAASVAIPAAIVAMTVPALLTLSLPAALPI